MIKLIVFDLDDTLAGLGKGITAQDIELLRQMEKNGARIAICSGKPTYYLCGFMRQVELEKPILVGENGAVIQIGVDLPPREFYIHPYSEAAKNSITLLKTEIDKYLPQMWYQPNIVGLTPFPTSEEEFTIIANIVEEQKQQLQEVIVYRHVDSFDITPEGIDKETGIRFLGKILGIPMEEIIAVGNGVNDYPMFRCAGYSVGVNLEDQAQADVNFTSPTEALRHILKYIIDHR